MPDGTCVFPKCTGYSRSKTGLCPDHLRQKWLGRELAPVIYNGKKVRWHADCAVLECEKLTERYRFCSNHQGKLKRFSLTNAQAVAMFNQSSCDACGSPVQGQARHIDHDHACCAGNKSCGKCVRGVLCVHCNVALGLVKDDPSRLQLLIDYLAGTALSEI
jgi:hypothetical protein